MNFPTPTALGALAKIVAGFPLADLLAILNGTATVDSDLDLAEQAVGLIAAAFPPAAITAEEVGFGLEALAFLCDAAGLGAKPIQLSRGQNPIRGGFDGARGHL